MGCTGTMNDGVFNCFGHYSRCMCYHCIYDDEHTGFEKTGNQFKSHKDAINELFEFLKGEKLPEGVHCKMPKLSAKMAFTVIWLLQEHFHVLPDNIEQCKECLELYDANSEGYCLTDEYKLNGKKLPKKYQGNYCDSCVPDIDFECP